nr:hypothetical protein [Tanacetum cinerariifolium]GFA76530.1 hypothetical protein [Tanacetum cinerariifolium]
MAPLTFTDTHNMIAFLTKSDASEGFDQIVDFLNAHPIQYALMVNPPIYVSCIKQFWDSVSVKKTNDVVRLQALIDRKKDSIRQDLRLDNADGVECLPNEEIFAELFMSAKRTAWNEVSSSMASVVICLAIEVDDLSSHNTKYTSPALTQKVFVNMRRIGKGFSGVETLLFDTMLVQPQADVEDDDDDDERHVLISQKVAYLEQDKVAQALEITKLKQRVKKLEKKRRFKSSGLKRLRKVELGDDEDVTLVDVDTTIEMDDDTYGRMEEDVTVVKEINVAEPIVFDNEEVTMTMAQTLIKIKAKKARILDEQMAKRLEDEEIEQAAARKNRRKRI